MRSALVVVIFDLAGNDHVFPAYHGERYYEGTPKVWERIRTAAELNDVRVHDLRHSFASIAVSGGASLPIIGALLGHAHSATTQRYTHLSDDPLRAASEAVGSQIAASLNSEVFQIIVPFVQALRAGILQLSDWPTTRFSSLLIDLLGIKSIDVEL